MAGQTRSHANNSHKRVYRPNLQRVKAFINGTPTHIRVCTRCIRNGVIQRKPTARPRPIVEGREP